MPVVSPEDLIREQEVRRLVDEIERQVRRTFDGHRAFVDIRGRYDPAHLEEALGKFIKAGWGIDRKRGIKLYKKR